MITAGKPTLGFIIALVGMLMLGVPSPASAAGKNLQTPPVDSSPPVISQPSDLLFAAIDATGASVVYSLPTAVDDVDGEVPVGCNPASGSLFALGLSTVTCQAHDAAGNQAAISFTITVSDQTPPVVAAVADVLVDAAGESGAAVDFARPTASDNVNGAVAVVCDADPGSIFPVGTTLVTCWAMDSAGNQANPVGFYVIVNAPQAPTPTDPPTAPPATTQEPNATDGPTATDAPADLTKTPRASETPTAETTPTNSTNPKEETPTPTATIPAALELPWPPPDSFVLVTDGGPIMGLSAIWQNQNFPITQEFGHTDFSVRHHGWYAYGASLGLDGYEHPGIDIGMPAGTWLYSPVSGTVEVAGGVPSYTFYGNGQPGVGELMIETDDGNQVILGHMGLITVTVGQHVNVGEFVGLSGGDNGDHLHLETRELQSWGGYLVVDPRRSFLIPSLEEAARKNDQAKSSAKEPQRLGGN